MKQEKFYEESKNNSKKIAQYEDLMKEYENPIEHACMMLYGSRD